MTRTRLRAPLLVAALALLWGSGFFWIKLSLAGLSPFQLTFARLALGAAVLGIIVAARRLPLPRSRAMWGHLTVAALISNAVPYTLFAIAEQTVPSSLAGTVNATTPLWTALLAYAASSDTGFTMRRVAGLIVGFAGALILLSPWNAADLGSTLGIVACLSAALSYGLSYVYQARYVTNRGYPPLVLAFGQLCASTVLLALTLPVAGGGAPQLTTMVLAAVVVLGVLGTGAAYVINYALITTEGPTAASVVTYLVPAVAVALGVTFLGEPIGPNLLTGGALILLGVALVRRRTTQAAAAGQAAPRG
ncbi:MAG: EamA family transporter [Pseudonocardiaceae bacterium]|nr:EamA family transporter [Pseudonocardiaceae bacterium]